MRLDQPLVLDSTVCGAGRASIRADAVTPFCQSAVRTTIRALFALVVLSCGSSLYDARADTVLSLTLKDHKFTPAELSVVAGERFLIEVQNLDPTPAEFESSGLKVEKIVVGGGKIIVRVGPLRPGNYKFFDDYHPDEAVGTLIAAEPNPAR
jgi:hypothetical protein